MQEPYGPAAALLQDPALAGHIRRFLAFARSYRRGEPEYDRYLELKEEHTFRVLERAARIADQETAFAAGPLRRALLLAALYHDLARFPQFASFRTFSDARSFDHGLAASRELGRGLFLAAEPSPLPGFIRAAVAVHNRARVPRQLASEPALLARALRDADKLDILVIMLEHYRSPAPDAAVIMNMADSAEPSPAVVAALREKRQALYADMRTRVDFQLLLMTWVYDIYFPAALRMALDEGLFASMAALLPDAPLFRKLAARYAEDLERLRAEGRPQA